MYYIAEKKAALTDIKAHQQAAGLDPKLYTNGESWCIEIPYPGMHQEISRNKLLKELPEGYVRE